MGVEARWQRLLFPTISGRQSGRCCRPSRRSRKAGDRACRTGWRWLASSSFCAPASNGGTCPLRWAAAARRAGVGWLSGMAPGFGGRSIKPCWNGFAVLTALIGAGPRSTVRRCAPKGGRGDRAQPDGPWQGGHEAAPGRRWRGHAARPDDQRGQPARQPDDGTHPRRGAACWRSAWASAPTPGQAPRRQGV